MRKVYIHSAVSILAQDTFGAESWLSKLQPLSGQKVEAIHPNYKEFIAASALRRMATGVKMGVAAANKSLTEANISMPDAILTGSGLGCMEDTEKFLNSIIANDEEFLTPTAFIQSTHNTVGAQIALVLQCNAYNNTYVHGALSFESALLDAQLLIQQEEATHVLVGGIDELGTEFVDAVRMMEDQNSNGIKVPIGEGASFFVLSSEVNKNRIELLDIISFSSLEQNEISEQLTAFLSSNQLAVSDIDALILGNNGDVFDTYYDNASTIFPSELPKLSYKEFSGEFYTASAFGLFLGFEVLKKQHLSAEMLQNKVSNKPLKTILLYNQFKGRDHSFILLKSC